MSVMKGVRRLGRKELKAFRRVTLKKGERTTVRIDLGPDELSCPRENLNASRSAS